MPNMVLFVRGMRDNDTICDSSSSSSSCIRNYSMTEVVCILPNVNTVVRKRLDSFLHNARNSANNRSKLEKELSADPSTSLHLPAQNYISTKNNIPLLEFENGRALTILPGVYVMNYLALHCSYSFHSAGQLMFRLEGGQGHYTGSCDQGLKFSLNDDPKTIYSGSRNEDFEPCSATCRAFAASVGLQRRPCRQGSFCSLILTHQCLRWHVLSRAVILCSMQSAEENNVIACFVSPCCARDRTTAAFLVGALMILKVKYNNWKCFIDQINNDLASATCTV